MNIKLISAVTFFTAMIQLCFSKTLNPMKVDIFLLLANYSTISSPKPTGFGNQGSWTRKTTI